MKTRHLVLLLLPVWLIGITAPLLAKEPETFTMETEAGKITVTQDIPSYFLGDYESNTPSLQPGKMLLKKGKIPVSLHWWDKEAASKKFVWGVLVKNGKIASQRITPPNPAYKPYNKMQLILQYEDGTVAALGIYRAESEKYGTRIVAGRYFKRK